MENVNSMGSGARALGAAFLFVFFASVLCDVLFTLSAGSGSLSDNLTNISKNITQLRISIMVGLFCCVGIIVLGALLYMAFQKEYQTLSIIGFGLFVAEATILAISKIGAYALIPLSQEFVKAGSPASSYFQPFADFLFHRLYHQGYDVHWLFFSTGGMIWYYLFLVSRRIPRPIAIWGIASICLLFVNNVLVLFDPAIGKLIPLIAAYIPYELVIGVWLMVKGYGSGAPKNG